MNAVVTWIPVGSAVRGQRLAQGPKPWPEIFAVRESAEPTHDGHECYEVALRFGGKRIEFIRVAKDQEIPVA